MVIPKEKRNQGNYSLEFGWFDPSSNGATSSLGGSIAIRGATQYWGVVVIGVDGKVYPESDAECSTQVTSFAGV